MLTSDPDGRERRLVERHPRARRRSALFFIVVGQLATAFFFFGDILLTFFLAWLLAFIISPIVAGSSISIPRLPRAAATVLVYTLVVVVMVIVVVIAAGALATSIAEFVASMPDIRANLPTILAPWQALARLDRPRPGRPRRAGRGRARQPRPVRRRAGRPLQQIAVASLGALGTMLIVFFLSIYMVVDRDEILAFLFRLVPPAYAEEARLLQTSVSRSFGGFLRGQALMGVVYFLIALGDEPAAGLPLPR